MKFSNLSAKQIWAFSFLGLYLFIAIPYFVTIAYIDHQLSIREPTDIFQGCNKIWATRGLVTGGKNKQPRSGNSLETISYGFKMGAKGSEIDMFYDVELGKYIISHDKPYNLKAGKLLSLEEVFSEIGPEYFIWLDLKKLGHLTKTEARLAVQRLDDISTKIGNKDKLYIESEGPANLGLYRDAGFKTIFDTRPIDNDYWVSQFVLNVYKMAYYFGDFTVMAMNYSRKGQLMYGEKAEQSLLNVPLFIYHVPDELPLLKRLAAVDNIRVIINKDHSANRFAINGCQ